jgi:TrmH family RNA methyltransferase
LPIPIELGRLRVVLVHARNPLNIGAAARAMSNFGFSRLRVVKPFDPAFREARSAVGAVAVLASAEEFECVSEAVADCSLVVGTTAAGHRQLQQPLMDLQQGTSQIRKHLTSGTVALLFGSEKVGLSNHDLTYCNSLLRIATREEHASMNLGQAVAICLYELVRTEPPLIPAEEKLATSAQIERITAVLLTVLHASGYVAANSTDSTEAKVRRLVRRLKLREEDAELWLGMLRQIVWKLRQHTDSKS